MANWWRSYRNFVERFPIAVVGLIAFAGCALIVLTTGGDAGSAVMIGLGAGAGSALGDAFRRERKAAREKQSRGPSA
jgi:hypothetical protein